MRIECQAAGCLQEPSIPGMSFSITTWAATPSLHTEHQVPISLHFWWRNLNQLSCRQWPPVFERTPASLYKNEEENFTGGAQWWMDSIHQAAAAAAAAWHGDLNCFWVGVYLSLLSSLHIHLLPAQLTDRSKCKCCINQVCVCVCVCVCVRARTCACMCHKSFSRPILWNPEPMGFMFYLIIQNKTYILCSCSSRLAESLKAI